MDNIFKSPIMMIPIFIAITVIPLFFGIKHAIGFHKKIRSDVKIIMHFFHTLESQKVHQFLFERWTCEKCGSELDRKRNIIQKKKNNI